MRITNQIILWIFGLIFALFGLMTIQYSTVILSEGTPWLITLVEKLANYQPGAEPGLKSVDESLAHYRTLWGSMSTHAMVGGFVVMLGVLQFLPSLRRNFRKIHRINGMFLGLSMTAVSLSGLYFLYQTPITGILAGESFYFALTAVAFLSLGLLMQAILAIKARNFRDHMIWMSLAFACFLTAPLLRLNYLVVANFDEQFLNRVVQNSSPTVLIQAFVLMLLWLIVLGDRDLPARSNQTTSFIVSDSVLNTLRLTSIAGLFCTSTVMVFQDLSDYFKSGHTWGLTMILIVTLTSTLRIWTSANAWKCGMNGLIPKSGYVVCLSASCIALLTLAFSMDKALFYSHALFYSAIHLAVIDLFILLLALRTTPLSTGCNLFAMASASLSWFWSAIPITVAIFVLFQFNLDMALTTALGLIPAIFLILAVISATGISLRIKGRSPSTQRV